MAVRKQAAKSGSKKNAATKASSGEGVSGGTELLRRKKTGDTRFFVPAGTEVKNPGAAAVAAKAADVPLTKERGSYDADSAYKLYLREIGQVKLLTPQEEIDLAALIKKGDKRAREQMIKANLRLVVKIAHDYEGFGLPLLDLISEGNIGLMKAVERFDPSKGGKLSTYGSWWIKQSIKRALANQSKTIRLPVHLVDKISKMRRVAMKLAGGIWPRANRRGIGRGDGDDSLARGADAHGGHPSSFVGCTNW